MPCAALCSICRPRRRFVSASARSIEPVMRSAYRIALPWTLRAARHVNGRAVLYADRITGSIERALAETGRRRAKQIEHNAAHGITPQSIRKAVTDVMEGARGDVEPGSGRRGAGIETAVTVLRPEQAMKRIKKLEAEMHRHARNLEFEQAAQVRDEIERLRHQAFGPPGAMAG